MAEEPFEEPTITEADMKALFEAEGKDTNLTVVQAENGRFLARNHGVTDDGKSLHLTVIGRIIYPTDLPTIRITRLS